MCMQYLFFSFKLIVLKKKIYFEPLAIHVEQKLKVKESKLKN